MKKKMSLLVLMLSLAASTSIRHTAFAENAGEQDVFIVQNGKEVELECAQAKAIRKLTFGPASKFAAFIPKNTSAVRTKTPVIFVRHDPSRIHLVKFDNDTYKDKPVRYFMQGAGTNVLEKFDVAFRNKKTAKDLYKITPEEPLLPGEYGIVVYGLAVTGISMDITVCDFGVDK